VTDTIVVGYDGHEHSQRALARAIDEAKTAHGRLLIVAVEAMPLDPYAPPSVNFVPPAVAAPPAPDPLVEPTPLKSLTDEAMARAEAAGVPADFVWAVGDPARTIVDTARDNDARSIVVGLHHHNLLERLLGEDVDAAVKEQAKCDVITVE